MAGRRARRGGPGLQHCQAIRRLTDHGSDVSTAHLDAELHLDADDLANPFQAVVASAASFILGALLPLLAILPPPAGSRVPVTFAVVLVALGIAGAVSAHIGGSPARRAVLRVVVGGAIGLAFAYGVGNLFGTAIG